MSADVCKFCKGSGWYEPKNMGGMIVEPCNRCDAHKTIQAAQKTSADVCPVCGCADPHGYFADRLGCGALVDGSECHNAPDLAISRAAEIERLKAEKAELLAELVTTADFFEHYSCLAEAGQADIEDDAENRIASARALITRHSLNETNQET